MKILRVIAIVLMGLTAVFTLMSGAGTVCVALGAEKFGGTMYLIRPYKWLYVLFVLATLAIGVLGVRALVSLIKGRRGAYRSALLALVLGVVIGGIHIFASRSIRGASMPVDAVVWTTLLTLVFFLFVRIPPVWAGVNFEKSASDKHLAQNAAALSICLCGLLTLTVQTWAGPTHMIAGVNYADAWHTQLAVIGWGAIVLGIILFAKSVYPIQKAIHPTAACAPQDL